MTYPQSIARVVVLNCGPCLPFAFEQLVSTFSVAPDRIIGAAELDYQTHCIKMSEEEEPTPSSLAQQWKNTKFFQGDTENIEGVMTRIRDQVGPAGEGLTVIILYQACTRIQGFEGRAESFGAHG